MHEVIKWGAISCAKQVVGAKVKETDGVFMEAHQNQRLIHKEARADVFEIPT